MAIAWVGVVAGHVMAYVLTYPSQGYRHLHLTITGHSWTGLAAASLLALVPVILLAVALRGLRASGGWSGSALAVSLVAIQAPAFLAIEVMERGWSAGRAATDPAVFVGLILQPLIAVVAAWVLELLRRTVRAIAGLLRARPAVRPASVPRPGLGAPIPRSRRFVPARLRAPPTGLIP